MNAAIAPLPVSPPAPLPAPQPALLSAAAKPPAAAVDMVTADQFAALPSFVYRSEAFAEDLPTELPAPAAWRAGSRRWPLLAWPGALVLAGGLTLWLGKLPV
jgi:hypothetical protein